MINMPADICVSSFLNEANRLGVGVRWEREMTNLDAAYVALPGDREKFFFMSDHLVQIINNSARY